MTYKDEALSNAMTESSVQETGPYRSMPLYSYDTLNEPTSFFHDSIPDHRGYNHDDRSSSHDIASIYHNSRHSSFNYKNPHFQQHSRGFLDSHSHGYVDSTLPYLYSPHATYEPHVGLETNHYDDEEHYNDFAPRLRHNFNIESATDHGHVPVTIVPIPVATGMEQRSSSVVPHGLFFGELHDHDHSLSFPFIGNALSQSQASQLGWDEDYLKELGYNKNGWASIWGSWNNWSGASDNKGVGGGGGGGGGVGGGGAIGDAERGSIGGGGCGVRIDLAFLFDSAVDKKDHFDKLVDFAKEVVGRFRVAEEGTRVGAAMYRDQAEIEFNFDAYKDNTGVLQGLEAVKNKWKEGASGRSLDRGLTVTKNDLFEATGREDVWKVLIVLTDGQASQAFAERAQELRDSTVNIFAIGVKGKPDDQQLKTLATDDDNHHQFTVEYSQLDPLVSNIPYVSCKVDVVFVVDCGDTGTPRLANIKSLMKRTIQGLEIAKYGDHVSVITTAKEAEVKWDLNGKESREDLIKAIDQLTCPGDGRNFEKGLVSARDTFLKTGHHGWINITVFITDSKMNKKDEIRKAGKTLRDVGTIVHAVGFGNQYARSDLELVASTSEPQNVFIHEKNDINQIDTIGDKIGLQIANIRKDERGVTVAMGIGNLSPYSTTGDQTLGVYNDEIDNRDKSYYGDLSQGSSDTQSTNTQSFGSLGSTEDTNKTGKSYASDVAMNDNKPADISQQNTSSASPRKLFDQEDIDKVRSEDVPAAIMEALRDFSVNEDKKLLDDGLSPDPFTITGIARQAVVNVTNNTTTASSNNTTQSTTVEKTTNTNTSSPEPVHNMTTVGAPLIKSTTNETTVNQSVSTQSNSSSQALNEGVKRKIDIDQVKGSIFLTGMSETVDDKIEDDFDYQASRDSASNNTNVGNKTAPGQNTTQMNSSAAVGGNITNVGKNSSVPSTNVTYNGSADSQKVTEEPLSQGSLKKSRINSTDTDDSYDGKDPYSSIGTTLSREMGKAKLRPSSKPNHRHRQAIKGVAKTVRPRAPPMIKVNTKAKINAMFSTKKKKEDSVHTDVVLNEEELSPSDEDDDDLKNDLEELEELKKEQTTHPGFGLRKTIIQTSKTSFNGQNKKEVVQGAQNISFTKAAAGDNDDKGTSSVSDDDVAFKKASIAKSLHPHQTTLKQKEIELSIVEETKKSKLVRPRNKFAGVIQDDRKKSYIANKKRKLKGLL